MTNVLDHAFLAQDASAAVYLGWWKVLLMYLFFIPWAWVVSAVIDKDAQYFHLNRRLWGSINVLCGLAALAAMLLIPIFWVGWPVGLLLLIAPVLVYWKVRNDAVPEGKEFSLSDGLNFREKMEQRKQAKASREAALRFVDHKGVQRDVPVKEDPRYTIHIMAEDLLGPALEGNASRVDVQLNAQQTTISQTVDGVKYKREPLPAENGLRLFTYLKDLAGMDLEEQRRRQTGTIRVTGPAASSELTITARGASNAQVMRIDIDRKNRLNKPFDGLGLLGPQVTGLQKLDESDHRHGVVLIGAPSGHGLTTTAYSLLARHDAYTSNIKSLERDVMHRIEGVDHVTWDASNPAVDYASHLQSLLRRDPDVVLAMDVRDHETAKVASDPGLDGPLIYVPLPSATIVDLIREWAKLVGDVKKATTPLQAAMNQRLLRTLCPNCRQAYTPTSEQLAKLNLPADKVNQLYRASGKVQVKNKIESCQVCKGTGYLGQTGAFEVMMIDDEARKHLMAGDLKAALAHARRNKMIYLQEAALSKVVAGETSVEEVIRVTAPKSKS